jgi:hypothetical protein
MHCSISFIPESDYILVKMTGEINIPEMRQIIVDAGKAILEHNCNDLLGDFRETSLPVNIMELIDLYEYWIKTLKNNHLSTFEAKRVILITKEQTKNEKFRFFETFSTNRSSRVRLFYDFNEGVRWLKGI